jgi:hypothetical protein
MNVLEVRSLIVLLCDWDWVAFWMNRSAGNVLMSAKN